MKVWKIICPLQTGEKISSQPLIFPRVQLAVTTRSPFLTGEPRKNPPTFHYTGWLIGILTMVYYNPYIAG